MPQIAQLLETYASQIFWLLIVFGLIYFGIGRSMLPKIEATVDARARKVAEDLAAADKARADADATEEAWRTQMAAARAESHDAMNAAKAKAIAATEVRVKAADAEAAQRIAAAEASIRAATQTALAEIEGAASEAAQAMVAKLSGAHLAPGAAAVAVKEAMARG